MNLNLEPFTTRLITVFLITVRIRLYTQIDGESERKVSLTTITYKSKGDYLQNIVYNDTNKSLVGKLDRSSHVSSYKLLLKV